MEDLDKELTAELSKHNVQIVGEGYYREGLGEFAEKVKADIAVLSPCLPGRMDIVETIRMLRFNNIRIIFLPGEKEEAEDEAKKAVALGVYDIVWDPVNVHNIVHCVFTPTSLADVGLEPDVEGIKRVDIKQAAKKEGAISIFLKRIANRFQKHPKQEPFLSQTKDNRKSAQTFDIKMDLQKKDALTGLLTRDVLAEISDKPAAIVFCDLDRFKKVNDNFGHKIGDKVLQEFSSVLRQCVRDTDLLIRWGGDEFVAVIPYGTTKNARIIEARIKSLWTRNLLAQRYNVSVSIGIAKDNTLKNAISEADIKMYENKKHTKPTNRIKIISQRSLSEKFLKNIKNHTLVDIDGVLVFVLMPDEIWKSDWRLGLRAQPVKLPYGVQFYSCAESLGKTDRRDYEIFDDFILALLAQSPVIVNTFKPAFISRLTELGATKKELI
jgi:diguanylate cyclase (GGDEF)-like protein